MTCRTISHVRKRRIRRRRSRAAAFTLVELLVVIGIVAVLIAILLPSLARAREEAKYVRWQAFSRDLSLDPNLMLYFNFQNDLGQGTITNMAVNNQDDPGFVPSTCNGWLCDWTNNREPLTDPTRMAAIWSNDGRFRGKPAVTFPNGAWIAVGKDNYVTGKMANLLRKKQAITIVMWVYVPPSPPSDSIIYWAPGSDTAPREINVHMPYGGTVYWDAPYDASGSQDRCQTPFSYGNSSAAGGAWTMWAFTKDAGSGVMKIYLNGQLVQTSSGNFDKFTAFDTNIQQNNDEGNLSIGHIPSSGPDWSGTLDEIAIFDADISPTDVPGTGTGPLNRFQQMYDMGSP